MAQQQQQKPGEKSMSASSPSEAPPTAAASSRVALSPLPLPPPPAPPLRVAVGDKRKAMIKELAAFYRNECQSYCRQLLTLQRQWRQ
ncbi:unnamed protein product, partial [Sphagnum troendelagicum]